MPARHRLAAALTALAAASTTAARAQQPDRPLLGNPTGDSVVQRIYDEGMHRSRVYQLAQVLTDSIGPRLTGSPANRAANDWLVRTYQGWGITARNEKYGTWRDWTRGQSRVELLAPRARTLEATMLAWSPPTPAGGATGEVVILPGAAEVRDSAGFGRWLATLRGKFVLASQPLGSCRPEGSWTQWASPDLLAAAHATRDSAAAEWRQRVTLAGGSRTLHARLEGAGAAGILTTLWSRGWGVEKIFAARTGTAPTFEVSCEDYGLLARLAAAGQHPRVRAVAESRVAAAEAPVYNTVAEVRGSERPDEYVVLSAHLDSWDGASGATDNATGTVVMLEAMRILRAAYPRPRRTILAGHWSGEEQGDIGSSAFAADHPEVIRGMQALFNQDNGTGQIDRVVTAGFLDAPASFARWLSRMPADVTAGIALEFPGHAHDESSDSDAFACRNAPAFFLNSADWDYNDYTWHTNRDTFDKISVDAVKQTATLVAMLAYQAAEDPARVSRARRVPPVDASGRPVAPPECSTPPRSWAETQRP
jgi:hypothetical protein